MTFRYPTTSIRKKIIPLTNENMEKRNDCRMEAE